ncbi:MAG: acyl-CoA reductase [Thermaurantiacus tibetensis]|uniref:acyl-CoA reductase n=1 Tax=Thermaurantiacus tibetensis TaxID=2759035 RepID=UPI00188F51FE|nr:acyl-CoA reductase [Thermaurantiacus tibetensis]
MADQPDPLRCDPLGAVEVVLPRMGSLAPVLAARPLRPFSPEVLGFIDDLGRRLRTDPALRPFPELVALGFWARRANVERLRARFEGAWPEAVRMPRGLAFHVAPANVDTIFVYSLLLSMLAGNRNIVRISSRARPQADQLLARLAAAVEAAAPEVGASFAIIRYPHDDAITAALSAAVDVRVVWGGDASVAAVRRAPLGPFGTELVFPDRWSLAVFDAGAVAAEPDLPGLARRFVNDSLWFGQNACSSPRALVWVGTEAARESASAAFWPALETASEAAGIEWADAHAVAKLVGACVEALGGRVVQLPTPSNRITVLRADGLSGLGHAAPAGDGFFLEYHAETLAQLAPHVARNWQTVVSHGIPAQAWRSFLASHMPHGIDRIVPAGTALDFDALWDGVDLLSALTRLVDLRV